MMTTTIDGKMICRAYWCDYKPRENGFCGHHARQAEEVPRVEAFVEALRALAESYQVELYATGYDEEGDVMVRTKDGSWEQRLYG